MESSAEACDYAAAAAGLLSIDPHPAATAAAGDLGEQLAAAAKCLQAQVERAEQDAQRHTARQATLRKQLEERCGEAERQHEGIAAAMRALADRLACLPGGASTQQPAPLLGLDLPDSYAVACSTLLDNLAGYLQHNFASGVSSAGPAGLMAAQHHQAAAMELEQLQACAIKSERLRVEEEAEVARLTGELEVLQAPTVKASAASLGYSAADLEAEVASLQRRRKSSLDAAIQAAEAAAATAAGAQAVQEQADARRAALEQRLAAKEQLGVAGVLTRHLARQLLIHRQLQHEQAMVQEVQALVAAARQDAEAALQAVHARLPGYAADVEASQEQQAGVQPPQAAAAASNLQAAQQLGGKAAQAQGQREGGGECKDPLATAQQLLSCRAQVQRLSEQVQSELLPAHLVVFARLHGLLYTSGGTDGSAEGGASGAYKEPRLELTPPALHAQLEAVQQAHRVVEAQAGAVLDEVITRQRNAEERRLAEKVLCAFWTHPGQLAAEAEKNRRKLATFAA